MSKPNDPNDYELHDEYDLSKMTIVAKGRYTPRENSDSDRFLLRETGDETGEERGTAYIIPLTPKTNK